MRFPTFRTSLLAFIAFAILLLALVGTGSLAPSRHAWKYADLRLVQLPAEDSAVPQVIAAYARRTAQTVEVRLDFLSMPPDQNLEIYLVAGAAGDHPGKAIPGLNAQPGMAWDILFHFIEQGQATAVTSTGLPIRGLIQGIRRDVEQETITLSLDRRLAARIRGPLWFQAFVLQPGVRGVASQTLPFASLSIPPPTAKIYFAFWNTFPSATPAQALRRWDGAHTGPFGQRHGLSRLISASLAYVIPITLLDLKKPESLAALDYVGGLSKLHMDELLTLPDLAYGDPQARDQSLALTRRIAVQYQLTQNAFYYGALPPPENAGFQAAFASLPVHSPIVQWRGMRILPLPRTPDVTLPPEQTPDTSMQGLNPALKFALLKLALQQPNSIYPLGGDLAQSPWADSTVAGLSFAYIAAHPWIQVLSADQLLELPASSPAADFEPVLNQAIQPTPEAVSSPVNSQGMSYPGFPTRTDYETAVRTALEKAPANPLAEQAWKVYLRLTAPVNNPTLTALQTNYLGVVGHLLAAAHWSAQPAEISDCSEDVDWDGIPECILANQDVFLILEPDGARLAFAAARDRSQVTQLVGPLSESAVGLSDPGAWRPELGPAGDPDEIAGAFVDARDPWKMYTFQVQPASVVFTDPASQVIKSYTLATRIIGFQLQSPTPLGLTSIFTLDPARLDQPGWGSAYLARTDCAPSCWRWQVTGGPAIQITTGSVLPTPTTFLGSRLFMRSPEDPNITYPAGHFLPFPLARLDLQPGNNLQVNIEWLSIGN